MNNPKKIVAIIPARLKSTRLPGKVLLKIQNKPIIQYVYESVKKSKYIQDVIVATDDMSVIDTVKLFGGEAVLTSAELRSGSDRIAYVAKSLDDAEIIVNVQGDEPLIYPKVIDQTIELLLEDSSVLVGTPIKQIISGEELINPNVVKVVIDRFGNAIYFSRSPIPYCREVLNTDDWIKAGRYFKHVGLYVFRKEFLLKFSAMCETELEKAEKLEQLRIIENGYKIKTIITDYESISIDTIEDFEKIKSIIDEGMNKYVS